MEAPPVPPISVDESEDDLAGFLAGLRQRYNLDGGFGQPIGGELALSTDAVMLGVSAAAGQPAPATQHAPAGVSVSHTTRGDHADRMAGSSLLESVIATPNSTGADHHHHHQLQLQQQQQQLQLLLSPQACSESGSCATPLPAGAMSMSGAPAIAAPFDNNTGTPTGTLMLGAGGAVAAAGSPRTTAAAAAPGDATVACAPGSPYSAAAVADVRRPLLDQLDCVAAAGSPGAGAAAATAAAAAERAEAEAARVDGSVTAAAATAKAAEGSARVGGDAATAAMAAASLPTPAAATGDDCRQQLLPSSSPTPARSPRTLQEALRTLAAVKGSLAQLQPLRPVGSPPPTSPALQRQLPQPLQAPPTTTTAAAAPGTTRGLADGDAQPQSAALVDVATAPTTPAPADWAVLSARLAQAGFGELQLSSSDPVSAQLPSPDPAVLCSVVMRLLQEFARREMLVKQLLAERDEQRREAARGLAECARLERARDDAVRAADRARAEAADVRQRLMPAAEAKHKEVVAKLTSELARARRAGKEAEAAAAAAAAAAASGAAQAAASAALQDADRDRDRLRAEAERLTSELAKHKTLAREAERAAATARSAAQASAAAIAGLEKQLRDSGAAAQEEVAALGAELARTRHSLREAEGQLAALRAQASSRPDDTVALERQLAGERATHEAAAAAAASELCRLRQALSEATAAAARAEAASRADSNAAAQGGRLLAKRERSMQTEYTRLSGEMRAVRDASVAASARAAEAEAEVADLRSALAASQSAGRDAASRAEGLVLELDRVKSAARAAAQLAAEQLQAARREAAQSEHDLACSEAELRRLRAAVQPLDVGAAVSSSSGLSTAKATTPHIGPARAAALHPLAAAGGEGATGDPAPAGTQHGGAGAATGGAVDGDLAAALARSRRAEAALADAEANLVVLRHKLLQQDACLARKDRELDAMRGRLEDKVEREERRLARNKAAYARARATLAAARGGGGGGTLGAGRHNSMTREPRPLELVALYEEQKEATEAELAAARAEVRVLAGQLRDAQNHLIRKDRAAAAAALAAGVKGSTAFSAAGLGDPAAAAAAVRRAEELERELVTARSDASDAQRDAAKRLAEEQARCASLAADNASLSAELSGRPSHADHRLLKRELDIAQRKLAATRRSAAAAAVAGATTAAAANNSNAPHTAEDAVPNNNSSSGSGVRLQRNARAAMERDRAIARLGLGVVDEYPRDVLVDLVQDVCVVLQLRDATLLVPSLRKMAAVVGAIPRLQAFVAQVCEVVLYRGLTNVPPELHGNLDPGAVPRVLEHWLALLQQGEQLRQLAQQLQLLLATRAVGAAAAGSTAMPPPGRPMDPAQLQEAARCMAASVQALLACEARAASAGEVVRAAESLLQGSGGSGSSSMNGTSDGVALLRSVVQHVMDLLGVQDLSGLPAAATRLYVRAGELSNCLQSLGSLLGLGDTPGPGSVVAAVGSLVQRAARATQLTQSKQNEAAQQQLFRSTEHFAVAEVDRDERRRDQRGAGAVPAVAAASAAAAVAAASTNQGNGSGLGGSDIEDDAGAGAGCSAFAASESVLDEDALLDAALARVEAAAAAAAAAVTCT